MGYEIIVRQYDDDRRLIKEKKLDRDGALYDGVLIIGNFDKGNLTYLQGMSVVDIATDLANDETMIQAAIIAEAMNRANETALTRAKGEGDGEIDGHLQGLTR